jgi:plastocyanin
MNKKLLYLIIGLVIIVVGLGAYFIINNNGTSTDKNTTNTSGQSTTPETANTVIIKDFAFSPSSLTVKKGTTVTWKNEDSMAHTVKADTFESQNIATGGTFQATFNTKGTFSYICSIHPSMKGTVIVE